MQNKLTATLFFTISVSTIASTANWGYDGQSDVVTPADWGAVYPNCNGVAQSPVDIVTADVVASDIHVMPYYGANDVSLEHNGHTINTHTKRYIEFNSNIYRLEQFHFHTQSEHTIDGVRYDMEMHFVNKLYDHGQLVDVTVLGVLIEEGAENTQLAPIFNQLPQKSETGSSLPADLNVLLPENSATYHYRGSLTTPDCDEIVNWFVFKTPIEMSAAQISSFRDLFTENGIRYDTFRPVQPLNGRVVSSAVIGEHIEK